MKPGFSSKGSKKKNKQKRKAGRKGDGDDIMQDAATPGSPVHMHAEAGDAQQITAKDKQKKRMELKKALKVTVANLKSKRNKLTKLAGNKTERRQLNKQLQGLLQEQVVGKGSNKQEAAAAAAPTAADTMAE